MNQPLLGVVVCHGDLAAAFIGAVEQISGLAGALVPVTNSGAGREALEQRVMEAVGGRAAVVFVDLPSGSCLFASLKHLAGRPEVRVVTGVNLAMLLDFVFHREQEADAAARRAVDMGARAIATR